MVLQIHISRIVLVIKYPALSHICVHVYAYYTSTPSSARDRLQESAKGHPNILHYIQVKSPTSRLNIHQDPLNPPPAPPYYFNMILTEPSLHLTTYQSYTSLSVAKVFDICTRFETPSAVSIGELQNIQ